MVNNGGAGGRRRRTTKQRASALEVEPLVSRIFTTPGAEAAQRWLRALALAPVAHWHAEIVILADLDTRFDLNIYGEEWGFCFQHANRISWIRVTDVPFVHGRDEFQLLAATPPLKRIGELLYQIERRFQLHFDRKHPAIRTTLAHAEPAVRRWVESL